MVEVVVDVAVEAVVEGVMPAVVVGMAGAGLLWYHVLRCRRRLFICPRG